MTDTSLPHSVLPIAGVKRCHEPSCPNRARWLVTFDYQEYRCDEHKPEERRRAKVYRCPSCGGPTIKAVARRGPVREPQQAAGMTRFEDKLRALVVPSIGEIVVRFSPSTRDALADVVEAARAVTEMLAEPRSREMFPDLWDLRDTLGRLDGEG